MKRMNEELPAIEALLFVAGDEGLSVEQFKHLLNLSADQVVALLETLKATYDTDEARGLTVIETANTYKIATKKEVAATIEKYAQSSYAKHLTPAMLETLAIIAYKQPITRMEIEDIRGVQVSGNLKKLERRQLIKEAGRLDQPGRPVIYATTAYFLDYFGLNDLSQLPPLKEREMEATHLFFDDFNDSEFTEEEE